MNNGIRNCYPISLYFKNLFCLQQENIFFSECSLSESSLSALPTTRSTTHARYHRAGKYSERRMARSAHPLRFYRNL